MKLRKCGNYVERVKKTKRGMKVIPDGRGGKRNTKSGHFVRLLFALRTKSISSYIE